MKEKILTHLDKLGIKYENFEHEPAFSCDDAKGIDVPGERVKSLLLRNKKPDKFYMVVLPDNKQLDSNFLRKTLNENKLSFASPERMQEKIGVQPGHVSPFALINNISKDVEVIFDNSLLNTLIGFHPGRNDNTTVLEISGVEKYLTDLGLNYRYLEL